MIRKNKIYIIAEIGLNHGGNINVAKRLIKDAKEAGADAAKFQIFEPHTLGREKNKNVASKIWKRLFSSDADIKKLQTFCKSQKIDFICSIFDNESLRRIGKFNLKFIKIASSEVNNLELLKNIKKSKIPAILSTGMSSNYEISKAVEILKNPILLHCVSLYPCAPSKINLNRMIKLKKKYRLITGFSDHTIGIDACKIAIMNGARIIEKHFTYNQKLKGLDHILSSDRDELKDLVNFAKNYKYYLGNGKINPSQDELKIQKIARKGLYFSKNLGKGHKLSFKDITFLRPENGLNINKFKNFLGKRLKKKVIRYQSLSKKLFK